MIKFIKKYLFFPFTINKLQNENLYLNCKLETLSKLLEESKREIEFYKNLGSLNHEDRSKILRFRN